MSDYTDRKGMCERLSISRGTLYRMIKDGLPICRGGKRFFIPAVDAWMQGERSRPVEPSRPPAKPRGKQHLSEAVRRQREQRVALI